MRILVLGGTRFVGKLLVERLIKENHEVTILTRGKNKDSFEENVKRIHCSRFDATKMSKCLNGKVFDIVYDNICFSPDDAKITCDIFNNVGVGKYIFISSMSVYYAQEACLKEADFNPQEHEIKMGAQNIFSYEDGKRFSEIYFSKKAKFPVIFVRFPIIMGRNDYTGRFEYYISRILFSKNVYIPSAQGKMNYISSYIAADFLYWLKDINCRGPVNAASAECFNTRELIILFSEALKKKAVIIDIQQKNDKCYYPYCREKNMVLNITKATSMGYKFSSFHEWFPVEVDIVQQTLLKVSYK
ncbi:MAG: NAD-dependent epimerase/dehydratase family protein [bacterium]|nr:NAD-dependent epimerase/dehydratase family protein [bacterium]